MAADRSINGLPRDGVVGVAALTERIRAVLDAGFAGKVRVAGEVSGFRERNHWYFSLKEADAVVSCVCWSRDVRRLAAGVVEGLVDGAAVVVTGRVDYYPPQGRLQLYVEDIELAGRGALEEQLERLKAELAAAGYFAVERKRALPLVAEKVAVVTSRSAAALRDVEQTARQRWAGCELVLVDVRVQGASAAGEVAAAVDWLSEHGAAQGIEVVTVVRGGGSLEDLWSFNERAVADAIYRCRLPVVTGVGHEPDVTVAQLVADVGAATPTQAAMAVVPQRTALAEQVDQWSHRLGLALRRRAERLGDRLDRAAGHWVMTQPERLIDERRRAIDALAGRLPAAARRALEQGVRRADALERHLAAVDPQRVLERGFTYTVDGDGRVLPSAEAARQRPRLTTVFADGRVDSVPTDAAARAPDPPTPPSRPAARRRRRAAGDGGPSLFDAD